MVLAGLPARHPTVTTSTWANRGTQKGDPFPELPRALLNFAERALP
jgi:hypothetical protein